MSTNHHQVQSPPKPHETEGITPYQLAELACILSKNESDETQNLVRRALEIWKAACNEISGVRQYAEHDRTPFAEIADKKLLPPIREAYKNVQTAKGVQKAVERYFDALLKGYDKAMRDRFIAPELLISNKENLKSLKAEILKDKVMTKSQLNLLAAFQQARRLKQYSVSASEIRNVLGGADVGLPDPKL